MIYSDTTQSGVSIADAIANLSERIQQVRAQVARQQTITDMQQQRLNQQANQIEALTDVIDKLETRRNVAEFSQQNGTLTSVPKRYKFLT